MQLTLTQKITSSKSKKHTQCLIVLLDDNQQPLGDTGKTSKQQERIVQLIKLANFQGKLAETALDFGINEKTALLLVGIGKHNKLNNHNLQKIAKTIYKALEKQFTLANLILNDTLNDQQFGQLALALLNASYHFDKYKSDPKKPILQTINLIGNKTYQPALDFAQAIYTGQSLTRDVANEPANVLYPESMAKQAQQLAKAYPDLLKVSVIDEKNMEKLGMNCFLAVSRGSDREGKLIILEYQGKSTFKKNAPVALVGKGVTFDTGGISLKPAGGMEEMKFDMGGSASVLGTIKALCESRLPINVVGALACAENMPSGKATRPGDIVTAMNGKTVEIINTDAEGRLVLCDTLCYIQRYNPTAIIDVATLTGACVIALGHVRSAVYSNDEDLLFSLENASEQSGDLVWHMPLDDAYQPQLDSPIADMQNVGGRPAGSITASCFLSRFIEEGQAWAHLDVAGTAWNSGKDRNATGRPVPLFMHYLKNLAETE